MALADAKPFAVAAWALDEASGNAIDQVGSNDGVETSGTIGTASGKFDGARDFEEGDTECFEVADNADVTSGNFDIFLRAWVKLESSGTNTVAGQWDSNSRGYVLRVSGNRFQFLIGDGSSSTNATVTADNFGDLSLDTWYLVHGWYDSTANVVGIAVNGGTANTASDGGFPPGNSTTAFRIGASSDSGVFLERHWDGLIDDVVLLKDYILDADERTEDYNSGTGVAFADWDAGGGAMSGSAAMLFAAGSSTLTGSGAIVASSALVFDDGSSTLTGAGALAGSLALAFGAGSSTVAGAGALLGSSTVTFSNAGTVLGAGALAGTAASVFGAGSSIVAGAGALAGSSELVFADGSSTLSGAGALIGSSALVFAAGSSTLAGSGALAGSGTLTLSLTGTMAVQGALSGASPMVLAGAAALLGAGQLAGSTAMAFGLTLTVSGSQDVPGGGAVVLEIFCGGAAHLECWVGGAEFGEIVGGGAAVETI